MYSLTKYNLCFYKYYKYYEYCNRYFLNEF